MSRPPLGGASGSRRERDRRPTACVGRWVAVVVLQISSIRPPPFGELSVSYPRRRESKQRQRLAPTAHSATARSRGSRLGHHQRPYQRLRPSPTGAPPTKKPISHSRTAIKSTYQSTCTANPRPPRIASSSINMTSATIFVSS